MIEFFTLSWGGHIFIIFILGLCVLAQTLTLLLSFFRYSATRTRLLKSSIEISILFEILLFALLYGQMANGYRDGILVATGYENIRILVFLVILILIIVESIGMKDLWLLSLIPASLISLPIMENSLGHVFPCFFVAALIFFLVRSIKLCISSVVGIKTNISALSVTRAIDTLHTGVLFSEKNGYILLSNYQMQNLMIAITGEVFRNSIEFYDRLLSQEDGLRYKNVELDGQRVYLLNDGSAWIFTKTDIFFKMKSYIHISAADVTELWTLTTKLQCQNQELSHKSIELKRTIANLHILSKEREIDNAKIRAHDILGQRLTVLLRIIQNESNLDYDLLTSLSKGLLGELKAEKIKIGPYDEIKSIQEIFAAIGVVIDFEGELPNNTKQSSLFVDIIRESSTNAVRHGLATRINIKLELIENEYNLTIKNNGHTRLNSITPGSGIRVMRRNVSAQGGNLNIIPHPIFTLSVVLPGGD